MMSELRKVTESAVERHVEDPLRSRGQKLSGEDEATVHNIPVWRFSCGSVKRSKEMVTAHSNLFR
jgi:hypothetical protein